MKKALKFLSSLKLAVIVICSIATITAIGTFVESKYDAVAAKKLVYDSVYMAIIMGVFAVNLIAVMVDRWPWKLRHISFICAHIGILCIMTGQLLTNQFGIDGSMRVGIQDQNSFVSLPAVDVTLYTTFDGNNYTEMKPEKKGFDWFGMKSPKEVDFFKNPPTAEHPYVISQVDGGMKFTDYYRYAVSTRETVASENQKLGSGVRFQLSNGMANFIEWMVQRNPNHVVSMDLGPLKVHYGMLPSVGRGANEIYMKTEGSRIHYVLFSKESVDPKAEGFLQEGQVIKTPWMNLEFRILRFLAKAEEHWKVEPRETPTPLTTEAVLLEFKEQKHWMLLNDTVKLFSDNAAYFVSYGNRRYDIGFPIFLHEFHMEKYQGTGRAMSYRSIVQVDTEGKNKPTEISMNEPLKYKGMTIYQASFQDGPMGQPVASIFSINKDPGRWLKYLGSLIMTLGIIFLFYFRRLGTHSAAKKS